MEGGIACFSFLLVLVVLSDDDTLLQLYFQSTASRIVFNYSCIVDASEFSRIPFGIGFASTAAPSAAPPPLQMKSLVGIEAGCFHGRYSGWGGGASFL